MTRSWQRHIALLAVAFGLFSLTAAMAVAQDAGANGLELVELSGKLEAITGNALKIKTEDNQEHMVMVAAQTGFSYSGTADLKFLTPGLFVRFVAAFDNNAVAQAPLTKLEIFRPAKARRMSAEVLRSQTPGIYPVTDDKPGKEDKVAAAPAGSQNYQIVGQLRGFQTNKIQVAAGQRPIMVELSPELVISVASGDPYFCQAGDQVEISGLKNSSGLIQADTVQVKGSAPLGPGESKATGRNSRTRGSAATRGKLGEKDSNPSAGNVKKPKP